MKKLHSAAKKSLCIFMSVLMLAVTFVTLISAESGWLDESKLFTDRVVTDDSMYRLIGGVVERGVTFNNAAADNQIKGFVLEVDVNDPDTFVKATYNKGNPAEIARVTVRDQAHYFEQNNPQYNVVAAVNGGRYNTDTGAYYGALAMNGTVYNGAQGVPYFAILKDGTPDVRYAHESMDDVAEAVSGMVMLVDKGTIVCADDGTLAPRTAVGIKADGSLVFFMCDGRQAPESCGMGYPELAQTMLALGAVDAMALDGGGSTTVLTERESNDDIVLRNKPSYTVERTVATSLMICTTSEPTGEFDHVAFSVDKIFTAPGTPVSFEVFGADRYGYKTDLPAGGKLVVEDSSLGSITAGMFMPGTKTGKTNINYVIDGEVVASIPVEISKEADDLVTSFFKRIAQAFQNIINLIKTLFEKIEEQGIGNLGRV